MKFLPCLALMLLFFATPVVKAAFTNLDFESATVVLSTPVFGYLDWNLAVPGWSHGDGADTSIVYYNYPHVGTTQYYQLIDNTMFPSPLAGTYSLAMKNGYFSSSPSPWTQASIFQTGLIPADAFSVHVLATGSLRFLVNGNVIPMSHLTGNEYVGDISAYAGTTAEIKIVNAALEGNIPFLTVDNVSFSVTPAPEPSRALLALIGSGAVLARRRRTARHSRFD